MMQSADPPYTVRVGFFSVHSLASIGRVVYNRRKWDARLTRFSIYGTVKGPVLRGNIKKSFLRKKLFFVYFSLLDYCAISEYHILHTGVLYETSYTYSLFFHWGFCLTA